MTIDDFKELVKSHEDEFTKWCHSKWVVMPTGIMAVLAWIDYWYEEVDE